MIASETLKLNSTDYWRLIKELGSFNDKWAESVATKAEIFKKLIRNLNPNAQSILLAGFNPIAFDLAKEFTVSMVGDNSLNTIFDYSNVTLYSGTDQINRQFDIVLALDEFFTYAASEQDQRDQLDKLAALTKGWLITTLQDYKNFAPHKKNQIDATSINGSHNYIVIDHSIAEKTDKQLFNHYWMCIKDHANFNLLGPTKRRTMYFKQLAKYCSDAGSKHYVIQKNLLYKGFFSRNFEHIITVNF